MRWNGTIDSLFVSRVCRESLLPLCSRVISYSIMPFFVSLGPISSSLFTRIPNQQNSLRTVSRGICAFPGLSTTGPAPLWCLSSIYSFAKRISSPTCGVPGLAGPGKYGTSSVASVPSNLGDRVLRRGKGSPASNSRAREAKRVKISSPPPEMSFPESESLYCHVSGDIRRPEVPWLSAYPRSLDPSRGESPRRRD